MCRADYGDYMAPVCRTSRPRARKEHTCGECGRQILPGEIYEYVFSVQESQPASMHTCLHCVVGQLWLWRTCEGYIYGEVQDDLLEHAGEYPEVAAALIEYCAGMKRRWRTPGDALMPVPVELPALAI